MARITISLGAAEQNRSHDHSSAGGYFHDSLKSVR